MSQLKERAGSRELEGFRVMIVEDDGILALTEGCWLEDLGCKVMGPMPTVPDALNALQSGLPDGAVLDIDVCGTAVYPVARALARHRVPFFFVSASQPDSIEEDFRTVPRLMKPVGEYQLQRAALELFTRQ